MEIQAMKKYMKENHITYEELAKRSGISISTIKKIFSGISQYPRIDTIRTIERALGLDAPAPEASKEAQQLFTLLNELTEDELVELTSFVDFIISKRK